MSEYDPIFDFLRVIPHFEVGQRVRIVTMLGTIQERARYMGKEGHITGKHIATGIWSGQVAYFVEVKGLPSREFTAASLELVIPAGAKPGTWGDCPWAPDVV